ncbi:MAG: hypothetical protein VX853_08760, partial [Pseudomonadota bacterium]|nr:hypothetical protein [Pseudomonadota bacterium]
LVCPANGNQHFSLALYIAGFFRRINEHEGYGKHEGEAQQGVEQEICENVLIGILLEESVFQGMP